MKRRTIWIVAAGLFLVGIIVLCAGMVGSISGSSQPDGHSAVQLARPQAESVPAGTKVTPKPSPTPSVGLTKSTIALTVKTTEKQCFGSAGCNVQYEIRAAIAVGVTPGDCEVTYEVRGLQDAQIGTLTVLPSGRYTQDSYQSGQTSRASSKLKAVVTDIECDD